MEKNNDIEKLKAEFDFDRKRDFALSIIDRKIKDLERIEASLLPKTYKDSNYERDWEFIHAMHLVGIITMKEYNEYLEKIQRLNYKEDYDEIINERLERKRRLEQRTNTDINTLN